MDSKFTKGKWEINPRASRNIRCNGITIANCSSGQNGDIEEEEQANTKLIEAAPEMFEEIKETITDLKILRNQIESESKTNHLFDGMPELIQKWIDRKEQLLTKITEL